MEYLPESLVSEIFKRIHTTADRNSTSLVCKRLHAIEAENRGSLRVGCGLHPVTESLASLCTRFPNLTRLEIVYSGWLSNLGKQLDNEGLLVLSSHCPLLTELTLNFCSFINDAGLGHLASCRNLQSFKLNFAPTISSNGILSLVVGCKKLSTLHLTRCMKVSSVEWLEYLGNFGAIENLSIKNCKGIGEDDLIKLGPGWGKLLRFEFEVDAYYRYPKVYDLSSINRLSKEHILCEELKELSLTNCIIAPGQGLSCLLGRCEALEKLHLEMCIGVKDRDLIALSQRSNGIRCISLRLPSQFLAPMPVNSPLRLTDDSLKALALHCSMLEMVELSFSDAEFQSVSCFTLTGLLSLVQSCPIRELVLNGVYFFNDIGMLALRSAHFLKKLELLKCQEVSDIGMQLIVDFPCLTALKLFKCLGVTDIGLQPLVGTQKLETMIVDGCPQISEKGVQGSARCTCRTSG